MTGNTFRDRVRILIDRVFGGVHHVRSLRWQNVGSRYESARIALVGDCLSTWDSDQLTRLVFACHDLGLRGSVIPNGPRGLRVELHSREPYPHENPIVCSHPSLELAVECWRSGERVAMQIANRMRKP